MFKLNKEKDKKASKEVLKAQEIKKTTQAWMPVYDVNNNLMYRRDGYFVAVLEIEPINIDLLSRVEKKRIISSLHEVINGQKEYNGWISLCRPVDLDGYINGLQEKMKNTDDVIRKKLLQGYIKQSVSMASGGETLERKFYVIIIQKEDENAKDEIDNRIKELKTNLGSADLISSFCYDKEIIDTLFTFFHPVQAAYERAPINSGPYMPTQVDNM